MSWQESMDKHFNEFVEWEETTMKELKERYERIMKLAEQIVELAEEVYEPGMDYHGIDSLSQSGMARDLARLDTILDLGAAEDLFKDLESKLRNRLRYLKEEKEEVA